MKKPARPRPFRAWAIVGENGKCATDWNFGYITFQNKRTAKDYCRIGERVIPVMITPIEQKK